MSEDVSEKVTVDKTLWYGWWKVKPRFLQCLNGLGFYMPLAIILHLVFGFVSGWVGTALQEIEKQFGLASTVSATLATASDLGMTCSVIFVGYIGTKFNKARGLACGLFLFGLGLILNGLPHYLIDPYQPPSYGSNTTAGQPSVCPANDSSSSSSRTVPDRQGGSHMAYFTMLLVGQVISGIGSTPVYTLGISYLDDNAEVATAAILIGVVNTVTTVGAALSALVGGTMIEYIYVDFDRVDTSSDSTLLRPHNVILKRYHNQNTTLPQRCGNVKLLAGWWIGFIVSGLICVIISIPISGFPKNLPSSPIKEDKKTTNKAPTSIFVFLKKTIMDFFKALFKLIFDIEFIFLSIATSIEGVAVAGMSMFVFKFVNHEYDMDYDVAGYVIGTKAIVGSGGYILAGYLIKWFKLDLLGMEKASNVLYVISLVFGLSLFAACPNIDMPGVERPYPGDSSISGLISECQGPCLCDAQSFSPICGADGLVYFSPCHAGCLNMTMERGIKTFTNCSCVAISQNLSAGDVMATATLGKCDTGCWEMYFVMPCLFIVYIAIVACSTFSVLAVLRCVEQELKPFALSIKMIFVRVLGTIPAPLVVGKIVDSACILWSGSESDAGRFCQMYDKQGLTTGIAFMWLGSGLVSCLFMTLSILVNIWKRKRAERRRVKHDYVVDNGDVKDFNDVNLEKTDSNVNM